MMREWRKWHSAILGSERFGLTSDGAGLLYALLVVAQDDAAKNEWTPMRIRQLTVCRPDWTLKDAQRYGQELVEVGLCTMDGEYIVIVRGREKNGTPANARKPLFYDAGESQRRVTEPPRESQSGAGEKPRESQGAESEQVRDSQSDTDDHAGESQMANTRARRVDIEESREEESREEESRPGDDARARAEAPSAPPSTVERKPVPKPKPTHPTADAEYIESLVVEYAPKLGDQATARDEIDAALNHKARKKAIDERLYLRTWLNKAVRWASDRKRDQPRSIADPSRAASRNVSPQTAAYIETQRRKSA